MLSATASPPMPAAPRPHQIGRIGERLARTHLASRGFAIAAVNYRSPWGEIDLVARDGPVWVFVEVRARRTASHGSPEESLTPRKAARLSLTAQHYLAQLPPSAVDLDPEWRIDLIAIRLGAGQRVLSIRHYENVVSE